MSQNNNNKDKANQVFEGIEQKLGDIPNYAAQRFYKRWSDYRESKKELKEQYSRLNPKYYGASVSQSFKKHFITGNEAHRELVEKQKQLNKQYWEQIKFQNELRRQRKEKKKLQSKQAQSMNFKEQCLFFDTDIDDLSYKHNNMAITAYICLLFSFGGFTIAGMVFKNMQSGNFLDFIGVMVGLMVFIMNFISAQNFLYRCWCIRTQKTAPIKHFYLGHYGRAMLAPLNFKMKFIKELDPSHPLNNPDQHKKQQDRKQKGRMNRNHNQQ